MADLPPHNERQVALEAKVCGNARLRTDAGCAVGRSRRLCRTPAVQLNRTPFSVWVQHVQVGVMSAGPSRGFTSWRMPSSST